MEKSGSKNVLLTIMGVLILVEIVARIIAAQTYVFIGIIQLVSLVFTGLYGFWLYKKPHGNILKYAMLIFSLASILASSVALLEGIGYHIVKLVASAAVCYCAGRLNRVDQNKYLLPIIGLVFLGVSICSLVTRINNQITSVWLLLGSFCFTINYVTLMIAYFVRYKEHKEAGIMDASKKTK